MTLKPKIYASALTIALATATSVSYADNRTQAMGGAGVANGKYTQAASLNPALVANYMQRDNFGLVLPAVFIELADSDELVDSIDNFQDSYDRLERLLEQAEQGQPVNEAEVQQARQQLAQDFADSEGRLNADLNLQASLSIPNRFLATSIYFNADANIFGGSSIASNDLDTILDAQTPGDLDNLDSEGYIVGYVTADLGLAMARNFTIAGREVAIGVAPKLQQMESIAYIAQLDNFDDDDFDAGEYRTSSDAFNLDLGMSIALSERTSLGFTVRDLFKHEVSSVPLFSRQAEEPVLLSYERAPKLTAGVGYNTERMAFSADLDLNAQNYLGLNQESQLLLFREHLQVQFARAGFELDLARWVQFRAGYRHDLKGTYDDAVTAGLGFSPFGRVHINVSALYAGENNMGAGAQLAFTF
ncbi:conjugal transfer protein TraF [Aliidiomarina minuta]|uniref:conjugal transfer protein TraF n=1 Tax=Aliidiomarina minuta TaxID=880057 RepID=UPI000F886BA7|nr:conjugal transfer protein TraF [Aliidiomarina minuta]